MRHRRSINAALMDVMDVTGGGLVRLPALFSTGPEFERIKPCGVHLSRSPRSAPRGHSHRGCPLHARAGHRRPSPCRASPHAAAPPLPARRRADRSVPGARARRPRPLRDAAGSLRLDAIPRSPPAIARESGARAHVCAGIASLPAWPGLGNARRARPTGRCAGLSLAIRHQRRSTFGGKRK